MPLETSSALQRLGVAVLIGLLIGLDRERTELRGGRHRFAGVRTFPLIALSGALPMLLGPPVEVVLLAMSFLAVTAIAITSYVRSSAQGEVGATTEMSALTTLLLGALAGSGHLLLAGATGIVVAMLLVSKPRLEATSRALTSEELWAVLELAVISVIVLPLLPRRGYGPWQALNPFEIWLVVVLVSALSFVGFLAIRLLGERRGLALAGFVGGLISSTVVTLSMAERSRAGPGLARPAAAAVLVASTMMCIRMGILAGVVNTGILPRLLPVVIAMGLVGALAGRLLGKQNGSREVDGGHRFVNPFSLRAAVTFGAIYALVSLAVHAAQQWLGNAGIYAAAAVAGLADVDAPTIAITRMGPASGTWREPALAVAIAAVANSLVKLGLAVGLGTGAFRRQVAVALVAMAAAGAVVAALVYARA